MNAPVIILVNPQMGENIGATARAMANFGLTELRLVDPRDGWPNPVAASMAKGAEAIIAGARCYPHLAEAIADCRHVYATSGQLKNLPKPIHTPRRMAEEMRPLLANGEPVALLFGRERTGLSTEEAALARALVTIPTHPTHFSLNLAQAVVICAYEWWQLAGQDQPTQLPQPEAATMQELEGFFCHLESELDASGFFKTPELKPTMLRNLKSLFLRAQPTEQEVRTLRGVVTSLRRDRR